MINFSDLFKQTSGHCYYSPDTTLLASTISFRLVVRDAKNLEVLHVWKCLDEINHVQWSPDSTLLLVILKKRNMIQIFNIDDTSWKCRLDFASIPVSHALWTPDSRHVMTVDNLNIRIQLWSLTQKTICILNDIKSLKRGVSVLSDRIAILEHRPTKGAPNSLQDYASVLQYCKESDEWQKKRNFKLGSKNASEIEFSPCGGYIYIKDDPIHDRAVYIYRAADGKLETKLGVKATVHAWHNQALLLGHWLEPVVSLCSRLTWKEIASYRHQEVIQNCNAIYYEISRKPPNFSTEMEVLASEQASLYTTGSKFEIATLPYHLPLNTDLAPTISWLRLSPCGRLFASQRADMKRIIFIWGGAHLGTVSSGIAPETAPDAPHSIIETVGDITCAAWSPKEAKLAICTGNDKIYLWSEESILSIENPNDSRFCITALRWAPNGKYLILMSKTQMLICFV